MVWNRRDSDDTLATHPCPCGYLGDSRRECRCSPTQIQRYRARISGPLLDRIDLHVEAPSVGIHELRTDAAGEPSAAIRTRVQAAREVQQRRFARSRARSNARMSHAQLREHCAINPKLGDMLQQATEQLALSARAYDRIQAPHLLEAIQYRSLDRNVFY